ncbi:hypothetical protein GTS_02810 [Gandjariella thermophila]|uniref:Neurotransmitter-gated ion-channel ligand-binding domain-containing protein n=2 Tax=Gandjariella thermophila TaxID=1931992 RepID=A0A4D4J1H8_9PSEU|nr:hypothetical protein GTS_02810 [Gandjariella thermophila]
MLLAGTAATLAGLVAGATPVRAEVPTCQLGAYLADLYGVDTRNQTINADVWFWSVCARPELEPIEHFEFINATEHRQVYRASVPRGSQYWTYVKFVGTFRQNFDLRDYPFDQQTVNIIVEDTRDENEFVYTPDVANSTYNHDIKLSDFGITGFRVATRDHRYQTTFGDPRLAHGTGSSYTQFVLDVALSRTDVSIFVRQTWPVFVSFLVAMVSYLLWSAEATPVLTARVGLLGAALFAVVLNLVNLRAAGDLIGTFAGTTLVDQVHLITLGYVLVGVATTALTWWLANRPDGARPRGRARRTNDLIGIVASVVYVALVAGAVAYAVVT